MEFDIKGREIICDHYHFVGVELKER